MSEPLEVVARLVVASLAGVPAARADTSTVPFSGVYRTALATRLESTRGNRSGSAATDKPSVEEALWRETPFAFARD